MNFPQTLTTLDLGGNQIGDQGAGHLANALQQNKVTMLTPLDFPCNCLFIIFHRHSQHLTSEATKWYDVKISKKKISKKNFEKQNFDKTIARKIEIPKNLHHENNNFEKRKSRRRKFRNFEKNLELVVTKIFDVHRQFANLHSLRNRHMSIIRFGKFNKSIIFIKMNSGPTAFVLAYTIRYFR
jgi:hypothetical protein